MIPWMKPESQLNPIQWMVYPPLIKMFKMICAPTALIMLPGHSPPYHSLFHPQNLRGIMKVQAGMNIGLLPLDLEWHLYKQSDRSRPSWRMNPVPLPLQIVQQENWLANPQMLIMGELDLALPQHARLMNLHEAPDGLTEGRTSFLLADDPFSAQTHKGSKINSTEFFSTFYMLMSLRFLTESKVAYLVTTVEMNFMDFVLSKPKLDPKMLVRSFPCLLITICTLPTTLANAVLIQEFMVARLLE
jgi:hypothetical protein